MGRPRRYLIIGVGQKYRRYKPLFTRDQGIENVNTVRKKDMSFASEFTNANLAPNAKPFDSDLFAKWEKQLISADERLKDLAYCILSVMCCGARRPDAVARIFESKIEGKSNDEIRHTFIRIREAITAVVLFVGIPNCIPGCFGLAGVLKTLDPEAADKSGFRASVVTAEDEAAGKALRHEVYTGVGNTQVHEILGTYFRDLDEAMSAVGFGYLMANANKNVFQKRETELLLASSITALGATRQSRSHIKASWGLGSTEEALVAMVSVCEELCRWAGSPMPGEGKIDAKALCAEIKAALGK